MKNSTTFNFLLNAIGITLLLLMATIEYYNKIILSGVYTNNLTDEKATEAIYMFLRMSLWKIHLISGVLFSIVFLIKAYLNANGPLLVLAVLTLGTGGVNFYLQNNILSYIHISYSVVATLVFIYISYKEINKGESLC